MTPELIYMTCGAAASLTISLHALCLPGDEVVAFAPFFPEYKVFAEGAAQNLSPYRPASRISRSILTPSGRRFAKRPRR